MTGLDLIIVLKLPLSMVQYLYSDRIRPSSKVETVGYEIRERLKQLQAGRWQHDLANSTGKNLNFGLRELYELNKQKFIDLGVDSLDIDDEGQLIVGVAEALSEAAQVQLRVLVAQKQDYAALPIKFHYFSSLGYFDTPICCETAAGYGTVTTRHVVASPDSYKELALASNQLLAAVNEATERGSTPTLSDTVHVWGLLPSAGARYPIPTISLPWLGE